MPTLLALDLDVMLLPGARVPASLDSALGAQWRLCSRDGSSVGSKAAIWPSDNRSFTEAAEVGSDRRL